jgi:crotonobetainyl-CoA:carnitine CoA-transferase CaiB-like acyl-CoA transferase
MEILMTAQRSGLLDGIRVLDLSTMFAGAAATAWLADFGATVVKVENPDGDPARKLSRADTDPPWWHVLNRNKRVIGLRLSVREGAAILRRFLEDGFDVIVENFRPGTLEKWGLGYDDLRQQSPGLIMTRVSGYGQDGPLAPRPAYGTLLEAFSGLAMAAGEEDGPPILPPYGLGDHITGLFAAFGTVLAVRERERSGCGQVVDASIHESIAQFLSPLVAVAAQTGRSPVRTGNRTAYSAPRNAYRAQDGWVAIAAGTDRLFGFVAKGIGQPELTMDARFRSGEARVENMAALDAIIEAWTRTRSQADVVSILSEAGAPVAPVNDVAQFVAHEHLQQRGSIVQVDGVCADDSIAIPRPSPHMSHMPGRHWTSGRPRGWDSAALLHEKLGLSSEVLDRLRKEGVIA